MPSERKNNTRQEKQKKRGGEEAKSILKRLLSAHAQTL